MPIRPPIKLGAVGLNSDLGPAALTAEAWTACNHTITRDGKATRAWDPQYQWGLPIAPQYRFSFRSSDGVQYLVICDGTRVFVIDMDGATEEITPDSATPSRFITFCNHNGVLVWNSLARGPCYWPGPGNVLTDLPGWQAGWKCEGMASYKYYLVAWGMNESSNRYQHKIRWSNASEEGTVPTLWLPAPDNDAGDDLLGETSGALIGSRLVQDSLWLIKEDAIYELSYIGQPFILQTRRLRGVFEIASADATVEYKGSLIMISGREVYLYDGATVVSLINGKIRDALVASLGVVGFDKAKVFLGADNRYLFVLAQPASTYQHLAAFVLELETGAWGHVQFGGVYGLENVVFADSFNSYSPQILAIEGNLTGGGWQASLLKTDGSGTSGYTSFIERTALPVFGAPMLAMTTQAWLEVAGGVTFDVTFYSQETPTGGRKTDGPYTINTANQSAIWPRITGRYAGYRIETTSETTWELDMLTLRQEPAGEH